MIRLSQRAPRGLPPRPTGERDAPALPMGRWRASANAGLLGCLFAAMLDGSAMPASGATRSWQGGTFWSNPSNWNPVGIPQNGDDLFLGSSSGVTDPDDMVNDLTNLTVRSLTFQVNSTLSAVDWGLSGQTLGVMDHIGVEDSYELHIFINCGLRLEGNAEFYLAPNGEPDGRLFLAGPIDLNGHNLKVSAIAALAEGPSVELRGIVSGNGNIFIAGNNGGVVGINGADGNTFQGTVTVTYPGAHLNLHKQSGLAVPGNLVMQEQAVATLLGSEQIANNATLEMHGNTSFDLNGFNETLGSLLLINDTGGTNSVLPDSSGRLTVLDSITTDNIIPAPITLGTPLELGGFIPIHVGPGANAVLDLKANISGNGFDKRGPGTVRLRGLNTYFGDVAVTEGTVEAHASSAFGQGGPTFGVHLNGGSLVLQAVSIGSEPLFVNAPSSLLTAINSCQWNGPVRLNAGLNVVALDTSFSDLTFEFSGSNSISGPGELNLLAPLFGVGNVRLSGSANNTFTGALTVACQRLELNKPAGIKAFAGPLFVGRPGAAALSEVRWLNAYQNIGATLTLLSNGVVNLNGFNEDFGLVTFNGGRVETGGGQFAIYQPLTVNASDVPAIINGLLGMPPGFPARFNIGDGAADPDLLINAVVFGAAPQLLKQGPGTMNFSGANTYTGLTLVNEGVLEADKSAALGATAAGTIVASNATLRLGNIEGMAESFELNGSGLGGTHGALEVVAGGAMSGSVFLASPSTINVHQGAGLAINSVISGNGPLTQTGSGSLFFGGNSANTYSGDTLVNTGTLFLNKSAGTTAVPGRLILGPASVTSPSVARLLHGSELGASPIVTVNANALFDLSGNNQTLSALNLNDGGSAQTGAGQLNFFGGAVVQVGSLSPLGSHASASISGNLGLPPNDSITLSVAPYAPFFPFATGPELDVPALIRVNGFDNVNFAPAGFTKAGAGRMRLAATNTYKGDTLVVAGTLQVDGAQPQSAVRVSAGSRLQGSGITGHVFVSGNSSLAPGASPGILTCSNFNALAGSGTLQVELNGTSPGSGYDQLNVRGTVNLTGVSLSASLGFGSAVSNQFIIVQNDGSDAVTGTFTGLAQGATLFIGGEQFSISYAGGSGNDAVLTRLPTPPRPMLSIQSALPAAVRLFWPTNDPAFSLQFNANLSTTNWAPAQPPPVVVGTNNVVTNATSEIQKFYRLRKP